MDKMTPREAWESIKRDISFFGSINPFNKADEVIA